MARDHRELTLSTLDQALLSAINLAIAVLFIRFAPKEEYGCYTLVNGLVLLVGGVQAALVTTPLTANGARLVGAAQEQFVAVVLRLQTLLGLGFAALLAAGIWLHGAGGGAGAGLLAVGAALAALGTWMREFQRTAQFLRGHTGRVLACDVLFAALAASGLLALWLAHGALSAASVLAVVGLAALAPGLGLLALGAPRGPAGEARRVVRLLIEQGKWTLPGMGVTWGQNTGYAYVVALLAGSAAVAEVAAARLFIMPVNLLVTAWGRTFMPRLGALHRDRGLERVRALCRRSARALVALGVLYLVALAGFFALGGARLLPAKYGGLGLLVAAWGAFVVANTVRSVASVTLLSQASFRAVFHFSVVAAAASLALTVVLVRLCGTVGAVWGLCGGEVILAWLSWGALGRARPAEVAYG
jgi:O-antigen/teichoic acid export membrane protein